MLGVALVATVVALGACSSGSDDETEARGPEEILADAAAAMSTVESAAFTIEQTGAVVFIDDDGQLAFKSADGRFAAPASSDALVTIDALGFTTQVGAVAIDGELWFSNPLTGEWTEAPDGFSFDPAVVFDTEEGFPALLTEAAASDSTDLIDESPDPADGDQTAGEGDDRHHLRTLAAAARVAVLTSGLVTEESMVDLWIDAATDRVVEVQFEVDVDGAASSWRMTVADYDADVTITPPELGADG